MEQDKGFTATVDPIRLQSACDEPSTEDIEAFFRRPVERSPMLLTPEDRRAGSKESRPAT